MLFPDLLVLKICNEEELQVDLDQLRQPVDHYQTSRLERVRAGTRPGANISELDT